METNVKAIAQAVLQFLQMGKDAPPLDSLDPEVTMEGEMKATFQVSQYHDAVLQGRQRRRGPGGIKPLALNLFTVTIVGTKSHLEEEDEDGFLFKGIWITDPCLDETAQERVNPWEYYGEAYRDFRVKKGLPLAIGRTL